jgi:hypothetical protein
VWHEIPGTASNPSRTVSLRRSLPAGGSGARQVWQKHCSTESLTKFISIMTADTLKPVLWPAHNEPHSQYDAYQRRGSQGARTSRRRRFSPNALPHRQSIRSIKGNTGAILSTNYSITLSMIQVLFQPCRHDLSFSPILLVIVHDTASFNGDRQTVLNSKQCTAGSNLLPRNITTQSKEMNEMAINRHHTARPRPKFLTVSRWW